MRTLAKCLGSIFLIFLLTLSFAQERTTKRPRHLPCQNRTYKATGIGDGYFDAPGSDRLPENEMLQRRGGVSVSPYIGSDGAKISAQKIAFSSPEIARKNFEAVVASATRVLERGPAIGKEGTATDGERVLLDFSKEKRTSFAVMWQNKEYLLVFSSLSLQEVTDFEEKMEFDCN